MIVIFLNFYSSIKLWFWYNNLGLNQNMKYFRIKKYGKKFSGCSWVFVCGFSFFLQFLQN